jgi:hypothetical protein
MNIIPVDMNNDMIINKLSKEDLHNVKNVNIGEHYSRIIGKNGNESIIAISVDIEDAEFTEVNSDKSLTP